jgi:hypothetical protein
LGIVCQHKDYYLCSAINTGLQIELKKIDNLVLMLGKKKDKKESVEFSLYEYEDEDGKWYYIIGNRSATSRFLIPEQNKIDFFLMLKGQFNDTEVEEIRIKLKQIQVVLGAYKIMPESLKSKNNLLF